MAVAASLEELEACESDSLPVLGREGVPPRSTALRRKAMFCGSAVLAFAAAGLVVRHISGPSHGAVRGDVSRLSQKATIMDLVGTLADGIVQSGKVIDQGQKSWHTINKLAGTYNESGQGILAQLQAAGTALGKPLRDNEKLMEKIQSLSPEKKAMLKAKLLKKLNITNGKIFPDANTTDGNRCDPDEEEFVGLCYKRCSLLTGGTHPNRTSAFSCCSGESAWSCLGNQSMNAKVCAGFAVAGDSFGDGCPHAPGSCLRDEEIYGGICYMRCALSTWNVLPYRAGAATCCKSKGSTALDISECQTNSRYSRGGGMGDGRSITPAEGHAPIEALTEQV